MSVSISQPNDKCSYEVNDNQRIKVMVLFTCYNRCEKTRKSIESLVSGNFGIVFSFVIVDDNSSDNTLEMLNVKKKTIDITVLNGTGSLFYTGGMHMAMTYVKDNSINDYEYYLLINDDVVFFPGCIEKLIIQSRQQNNSVITGTTQDSEGKISYGAVKFVKNVQHRVLDISEWKSEADTFNANCVLVPKIWFDKTAAMDNHYTHAMGDWDYGFDIKRNGAIIHPSKVFIGVCDRNSTKGLWSDTSLSRSERLKRKENIKGLPRKQWFYYLKKNFGMGYAIYYSLVPYVNILLGR